MTAVPAMSEDTRKVGLLMESAQAHQALVTENLQRLQAHVRDLDSVVRDEIRRTLLEELQAVSTESHAAVQALRRAGHRAHSRLLIAGVGFILLGTVIPAGLLAWIAPSPAEIFALRAQRAELEAALTRLRQQGGQVEWRRCGDEQRLCVRIDRSAPVFGEQADYRIAKGY
jgi:hypothetical protein